MCLQVLLLLATRSVVYINKSHVIMCQSNEWCTTLKKCIHLCVHYIKTLFNNIQHTQTL